jgi:hypothetical protein
MMGDSKMGGFRNAPAVQPQVLGSEQLDDALLSRMAL